MEHCSRWLISPLERLQRNSGWASARSPAISPKERCHRRSRSVAGERPCIFGLRTTSSASANFCRKSRTAERPATKNSGKRKPSSRDLRAKPEPERAGAEDTERVPNQSRLIGGNQWLLIYVAAPAARRNVLRKHTLTNLFQSFDIKRQFEKPLPN
jgi:hypothetical protein